MPAAKKRTAILISGRGSNMEALVHAAQAADYPADIALVLSNRSDAAGLAFARSYGITTQVLAHRDYATREAYDDALDACLRQHRIELVCLAGFMRILTADFTRRWQGRMVNIHPSLLPAFKGLHTHQQALDAGVTLHGCSVHFVTPELDSGPLIIQAAVPVLPKDDADTLATRVLAQEHRIYPRALAWLAAGEITLDQPARACVADDSVPAEAQTVLVSPMI